MNSLSTFTEPFGWALLHFLWQGAVIALLLRAFFWLAQRSAPQVRYAAAGAAMLLMIGTAAGTVWWHWPAGHEANGTNGANRPDGQVAVTRPAMSLPPPAPLGLQPTPESPPSHESYSPAPPADLPAVSAASPPGFMERFRAMFPWLVGAWAAGVALCSVRLVNGWRSVRRWRLSGNENIPAEWGARFAVLCGKLRISRPVRLLSSASLAVPVVIGWLKPVVLVPAGLFSGIPAEQLEAILAHELAHVRRCDWLVNLLQTFVETVLFYHPAVWWVSAQLRREREHCCDDIAASVHGDTISYARALTALEELRAVPSPALSAAGGSLLQRIRRLAGLPEERAGGVAWPLGILTAAALALALVLALPRRVEAQQKDPVVSPSAQSDALKAAEPEEAYIKAYLQLVEADKLAKAGQNAEALAGYRSAKGQFDEVARLHPGWNAAMVEYRRVKTGEVIEALQKRLKSPAEKPGNDSVGNSRVEVALSAGKFELADGIKLNVTSSEDGKGTSRINAATIEWYAGDGTLGLKWPIELTAGLNIDPIVWERGGTDLWIVRNGVVRKLDYTNAADVKETVFKKGAITDYGGAPAEVALEILRIVNTEIARFEAELKIAVPAAESKGDRAKDELVISVKPDGSIMFKEKALTLEELAPQLTEIAKANSKQAIIILGSDDTRYDKIVEVLDATHKAGLYHVSIATTQPPATDEKKAAAEKLLEQGAAAAARRYFAEAREHFRDVAATLGKAGDDGFRDEYLLLLADAEVLLGRIDGNEADGIKDTETAGARQKAAELRESAVKHYMDAVLRLIEFDRANPKSVSCRVRLANAYYEMAGVLDLNGAERDASVACSEAVKILIELLREEPDSTDHSLNLAKAYDMGAALTRVLRPGEKGMREALSVHQQSVGLLRPLLEKNPKDFRAARQLSISLAWSVDLHSALGDPVAADAALKEAAALMESFSDAEEIRSARETFESEFRPPGEAPTPAKAPEAPSAPLPAEDAGKEKRSAGEQPKIIYHKNGTMTESVRKGDEIHERTLNAGGELIAKRVFYLDGRGRKRQAVIYDAKMSPLRSLIFSYDKTTGAPVEEQQYNKDGKLIRRLFYPGALKDPKYAGRIVAFSYDPDDAEAEAKEEPGDGNPTRPLVEQQAQPPPAPVEKLLMQGQSLYDLGQYEKARKCAEQALKLSPDNKSARELFDRIQSRQKEAEKNQKVSGGEAKELILQARSENKSLHGPGQFEKALKIGAEAAMLDPTSELLKVQDKLSESDQNRGPGVSPAEAKDKPAPAPALMISVVDYAGKARLKEFRVVAGVRAGSAGGKDTINWQPHTLRIAKNGELVWPLERAYDEFALRVEVEGYAPVEYKWIQKSKGPQNLSFEMMAGGGSLCQVWTPDKKPAAGAVVALAMVQRDAVIENGKLRHLDAATAEKPSDQWRRPRILKANANGEVMIPAETESRRPCWSFTRAECGRFR